MDPGSVFAGYFIERQLGKGGMGAVYLARHPRLPRKDALKVLGEAQSADPNFRLRFQREADLASRLSHPNIVTIYDRGVENDRLWISMQFIDGVDAASLVRGGPSILPPRRALYIVGEAAKGLDHAHRRGLLHRDVKPANIMIAAGDEAGESVVVTDFGIARNLDDSVGLTATGSVLATIAYAAPEQIEGGPIDHRVDVYALGCTLYEMLTGFLPFTRSSTLAVMHAHLTATPPRPTRSSPGLPPAIDNVIARAMAKNPADRYSSCRELAAAAAAAMDSPATPVPRLSPAPFAAPPVSPAPGPAPRHAALRIGAALAAIALVVALAVVITQAVGGGSADSPVAGSTTVATSAKRTPTTSAESSTATAPPPGPWGEASYIVEAFPKLLPATPDSTGYQGIKCAPVGVENGSTSNWLHCPGEGDQFSVNVHCDPSGAKVSYSKDTTGLVDVSDQKWIRPSGSGNLRIGTDGIAGFGLLSVDFDDPARDFCTIGASGGTSGQDVFDRWWLGAPF